MWIGVRLNRSGSVHLAMFFPRLLLNLAVEDSTLLPFI